MTWVIVTQPALDDWLATDPDPDVTTAVLTWVLGLRDAGPPPEGVFDPFHRTLFSEAGDTGIWIEYIVLPNLAEPAIVIRRYR